MYSAFFLACLYASLFLVLVSVLHKLKGVQEVTKLRGEIHRLKTHMDGSNDMGAQSEHDMISVAQWQEYGEELRRKKSVYKIVERVTSFLQ